MDNDNKKLELSLIEVSPNPLHALQWNHNGTNAKTIKLLFESICGGTTKISLHMNEEMKKLYK